MGVSPAFWPLEAGAFRRRRTRRCPVPSREKERPLFGEEQAEAREVYLLLVHLDLREVGAVGDVSDWVTLVSPYFTSKPTLAAHVVRQTGGRCDRSSVEIAHGFSSRDSAIPPAS